MQKHDEPLDILFQVNSVCWASVTHCDSHVLYPFCFSVFLSGSCAALCGSEMFS